MPAGRLPLGSTKTAGDTAVFVCCNLRRARPTAKSTLAGWGGRHANLEYGLSILGSMRRCREKSA